MGGCRLTDTSYFADKRDQNTTTFDFKAQENILRYKGSTVFTTNVGGEVDHVNERGTFHSNLNFAGGYDFDNHDIYASAGLSLAGRIPCYDDRKNNLNLELGAIERASYNITDNNIDTHTGAYALLNYSFYPNRNTKLALGAGVEGGGRFGFQNFDLETKKAYVTPKVAVNVQYKRLNITASATSDQLELKTAVQIDTSGEKIRCSNRRNGLRRNPNFY